MKKTAPKQNVSVDNIYQLDGRVPVGKAIPFGLQLISALKGEETAKEIAKQIVIR